MKLRCLSRSMCRALFASLISVTRFDMGHAAVNGVGICIGKIRQGFRYPRFLRHIPSIRIYLLPPLRSRRQPEDLLPHQDCSGSSEHLAESDRSGQHAILHARIATRHNDRLEPCGLPESQHQDLNQAVVDAAHLERGCHISKDAERNHSPTPIGAGLERDVQGLSFLANSVFSVRRVDTFGGGIKVILIIDPAAH